MKNCKVHGKAVRNHWFLNFFCKLAQTHNFDWELNEMLAMDEICIWISEYLVVLAWREKKIVNNFGFQVLKFDSTGLDPRVKDVTIIHSLIYSILLYFFVYLNKSNLYRRKTLYRGFEWNHGSCYHRLSLFLFAAVAIEPAGDGEVVWAGPQCWCRSSGETCSANQRSSLRCHSGVPPDSLGCNQ